MRYCIAIPMPGHHTLNTMKHIFYAAAISICAALAQSCNTSTNPGLIAGPKKDSVSIIERGRYLVNVIGCNDCHTPKIMTPQGPVPDTTRYLSGYNQAIPLGKYDTATANGGAWVQLKGDLTAAAGPWGVSFAANLTPDATGLGGWKLENFKKAIKEGKFMGVDQSRPIMPPMPIEALSHLSDDDVAAIFSYLKTVKPVKNTVPEAMLNPPPKI